MIYKKVNLSKIMYLRSVFIFSFELFVAILQNNVKYSNTPQTNVEYLPMR